LVVLGGLVIVTAALFALLGRTRSGRAVSRPPLPPNTQLYVPAVNPAAIQQIAGLVKSGATAQAAAITTLGAMPRGIWLTQGTPEEVRSLVAKAIVLAARGNTVPVFVIYYRPYRDCAGYSAGGALNSADYQTWIEGVARGIGNERAMVILEPDGTGIIPYYKTLDGTAEWCKPVVTDGAGHTIPAPEASPAAVFSQLNGALAILKKLAPNTLVYLDGTHSTWLPVSEVAHRLVKAGVASARGFSLNVSNFQFTWKQVYFGTWIATCIDYAASLGNTPEAFRSCPNQPRPAEGRAAWEVVDAWYVQHRSPSFGSGIRFVIDTSRNGQGPLDKRKYAVAPFNQPDRVLAKLDEFSWCNPPGAGVGERPTTKTQFPLLDAYLWLKDPGESDGSCDIASGGRAWDFDRYNPWGLKGDARNRFDPLWGMVVPAAGVWFPEQALDLAANGNPPVIP
jgi:endoglucanase